MKTASLRISPEMLSLIGEIDEFKGAWREMSTLSPERLAALKHVATIESIGSSTRIEGAKLSDTKIELLLGQLEHSSFKNRDEQEVAGYAETMETVFENFSDIHFSENYIKQLHGMLLRHSHKDTRHKGQYKTLENHVEARGANGKILGVIFKTASPFETPSRMQELVAWTKESLEDKSLHPLIIIGLFVVNFLAIHPFQDGNGRLSRILTTLLLLKTGYRYVPFSSLESIIEKNKESYYLALRRTQKTLHQKSPDWIPWLTFFLRSLKKQKERLEVKIQNEPHLEGLPPDAIAILEYVRTTGRITTRKALELTKTPRPTIRLRLAKLVKLGLLLPHGKGRGSWYGLPPKQDNI